MSATTLTATELTARTIRNARRTRADPYRPTIAVILLASVIQALGVATFIGMLVSLGN